MRLYGYWRSSASWRVRLALHLKGLAYETVPVHLLKGGGQQLGDEHKARNPMRQVPVLELGDGTCLTQSLAIIRYLDEVYPAPALLPSEPVARAQAWAMAEVVNAGIQPLQNLLVLGMIDELGGSRKDWGQFHIQRGFEALEAMASRHAGRYMVGDAVTVADLCLVPQMYNARRFGLELGDMPTLVRVDEALSALPAFQAAHPDAQPDAEV